MVTLFESRMAKRLALVLTGILVLTLLSVSLLADEPEKFTLTVTDDGGWVLGLIETVSVFPFDPQKEQDKARGEEAIASIDSPSDPVTFSLTPGNYEVVITVLEYGQDTMDISLGHIELSADTLIDLLEADLPFELFLTD